MCGIPRIRRQPGRRGFAGQLIHNIAATASVATGQHWPAPAATLPQWCMMIAPRLPPHTVQMCIHCHQRPAGSWASYTTGQTTRRPWRLSCRQGLDPGRCHVISFDGHAGAGRWP
jgi:hypothetical protein